MIQDVAQLIELLKTMPQDAPVRMVNYDGCDECNPESFPNIGYLEKVQYHEDFYDEKKTVLIF